MFPGLQSVRYLAILKWKLGECQVLSSMSAELKSLFLLLFDMPRRPTFDHETGIVPSLTEHVRSLGTRLRTHWGDRLAFVDATRIDDQEHRDSLGQHPLTELLERARLAGANLAPVVG